MKALVFNKNLLNHNPNPIFMFEFNEDGSLKLPDKVIKDQKDKEYRMKKGKCLLVTKEVISYTAPKRCVLHLKLSDAITDNQFVANVYKYCNENSETPFKIIKINENEFNVEIGTSFRRCSECMKLINRFKGFLYGNLIEEKGSCTYEDIIRKQDFCYEDYFD